MNVKKSYYIVIPKKKSLSRNNIYLKPNNIQHPARYIRISQKNIIGDDNTFFEKKFFFSSLPLKQSILLALAKIVMPAMIIITTTTITMPTMVAPPLSVK